MRDPRRYYQARVLLVPLGSTAQQAVTDMHVGGLTGVRLLDPFDTRNGDGPRGRLMGLGGQVGLVPSPSDDRVAIIRPMGDVDVVVLIVSDLGEVDDTTAAMVASAARDVGALVAGVVVDRTRSTVKMSDDADSVDNDATRRGRARLREQVDVLAIMRSSTAARGFVEAVRGGPDTTPAVVAGSG